MLGEIAALKHKVGNDTVKARSLVSETILAGRELAEVTRGFGNDVVVELELDTARGRWQVSGRSDREMGE
jgi:hypothetical protein